MVSLLPRVRALILTPSGFYDDNLAFEGNAFELEPVTVAPDIERR